MIQYVDPPGSPPAIGPFSQGVLTEGRLLFVSGQVGSRNDGSPEPDFPRQVDLAFRNRGRFDWDVPDSAWRILGLIGSAYGLSRPALGRGDLGHFELP